MKAVKSSIGKVCCPAPIKDDDAAEVLRMNLPFKGGLWGIKSDYSVNKSVITDDIDGFMSHSNKDVELALAKLGVITQNNKKRFPENMLELVGQIKKVVTRLEEDYEQELGEMDADRPHHSCSRVKPKVVPFTKDNMFGSEQERFFKFGDRNVSFFKLTSGLLYRVGDVIQDDTDPDLVTKSAMADHYGRKNMNHFAGDEQWLPVFQVMLDYVSVTNRLWALKKKANEGEPVVNPSGVVDVSKVDQTDLRTWFADRYFWILENNVIEKRSALYSCLMQGFDARETLNLEEKTASVDVVDKECEGASKTTPVQSAGAEVQNVWFESASSSRSHSTDKVDKGTPQTSFDIESSVTIVKVEIVVKDYITDSHVQVVQEGIRSVGVMIKDVVEIARRQDQKLADMQGQLVNVRPTAIKQVQTEVQELKRDVGADMQELKRVVREDMQGLHNAIAALQEVMTNHHPTPTVEVPRDQLQEVKEAVLQGMQRLEDGMVRRHEEQRREMHKIAVTINDVIECYNTAARFLWNRGRSFAHSLFAAPP